MSCDLRVLYISAKRGVETSLLDYLAGTEEGFSFIHFQLHLRSMNLKLYVRTLGAVFDTIKQRNPNIILLEGSGVSNIAIILAKYIYKIPLAVRVKGDLWEEFYDINSSMRLRELIRKFVNFAAALAVLKSSDLIIPISKKIEKKVHAKLGYNKTVKVVHIPFKIIAGDPPGQMSYGERKNCILTVTNFNFWAKVSPLADAINTFAYLLKKRGFSWIILGDGFFFDKFCISVKKQIDERAIQVLGRQNPTPFYREAKALFYISGMDGLPNVILEASLNGLPVFMNHDCPAVEFVTHGVNGVVVNFSDPSEVDRAMDRIQNTANEMGLLASNAYDYVHENYSKEKISRDLLSALREGLGPKRMGVSR